MVYVRDFEKVKADPGEDRIGLRHLLNHIQRLGRGGCRLDAAVQHL